MSMMATLASGEGWCLQENMVADEIWLEIDSPVAAYLASQSGVKVWLTSEMIDALRALPARFPPHLRDQRAAIFSERSRRGWQTRRGERKAQQDADIKTMIGFPADAPKSVTEIR